MSETDVNLILFSQRIYTMDKLILNKQNITINKLEYEALIKEVKQLRKLKRLLPNSKQLNNMAYKIATGNCTTKTMTEKQWKNCKTSNFMWEPFEYLGEGFVEAHVGDIADGIINSFKHLTKDV